jgi:hypothetical protein
MNITNYSLCPGAISYPPRPIPPGNLRTATQAWGALWVKYLSKADDGLSFQDPWKTYFILAFRKIPSGLRDQLTS